MSWTMTVGAARPSWGAGAGPAAWFSGDHHVRSGSSPALIPGYHHRPTLTGFLGLVMSQMSTIWALNPSGQNEENANLPRKSSCTDRKSTRLNSSHITISYAVFCLKKKKKKTKTIYQFYKKKKYKEY